MMWSIPALNTRETALVVWMGGLLLFGLTKADIRASLPSLVKALFGSFFLSAVIVSALAYVVGVVLLLAHYRPWEPEMTRVAIWWFVGFAIVAIFNTKRVNAGYYGRLVLHNIGIAVIVEFVVNLHTFPLPVELVLVPVAVVFGLMQALAEGKAELAPLRKPAACVLTILGLASLSFSVVFVAGHFSQVATADRIEQFLLPFVLTPAFIPFLVVLRYILVWQTMLTMVRAGLRRRSFVSQCPTADRRCLRAQPRPSPTV